MSYFDQIYSRIFPKGKAETEPVVVESLLKRNERFQHAYEVWKVSDEFDSLISEVSGLCRSAIAGENDARILLHQSNLSNGFALSFDERFDVQSFHFFFDHLRDQMKNLGYRLVMSRQTLKEKGDEVEKKEMHYLKPRPSFQEPIDQKYGNVQIEYLENDNRPTRIKFIANSYLDRKYTKALDFNELLGKILR